MEQGTIDDWVKSLTEESMPIFSGTVGEVTGRLSSKTSSASDVAQSVLQDASLTSRLLKLANSFTFNPSGREISSISRAVMILGFDQVKSLTLSLVLVDALEEGVQRDMLTTEMADAFHSAIQAEALAKMAKVKKPENVFLAALLSRIGNMAFWAFASKDQSIELEKSLNIANSDENKLEQKILGFALNDLSKKLAEEWSLGSALSNFLAGIDSPENNIITHAKELAQVSKDGWSSKKARDAIEQTARALNIPVLEIEDRVLESAKEAQRITRIYGAKEASKKIPQPEVIANEIESELEEAEAIIGQQEPAAEQQGQEEISQAAHKPVVIEANPQVQMAIMQDINLAIEEKASLNAILEMALEGIHRGVGMDRCFFAVLSPDRKKMMCKYALGTDNEEIRKKLFIPVTETKNILQASITSKKGIHVNREFEQRLIPMQILKLVGNPPYLIMPAIVKGKVIGLFMADRNETNRDVTDKDFIAFQQLCQQANMGMTFLTMKG